MTEVEGTVKKLNKRRHPRFKRPNVGRTKRSRLKDTWRRPRGKGNKQRQKLKKAGKRPSIGYGNQVKHIHPKGGKEILISSPKQLDRLKDRLKNETKTVGKVAFIRIAAAVGKRKRIEIMNKANLLGLYVLNPGIRTGIRTEVGVAGATAVSAGRTRKEVSSTTKTGSKPQAAKTTPNE